MSAPVDPESGPPFKAHRRYYLVLKVVILVIAVALAWRWFASQSFAP